MGPIRCKGEWEGLTHRHSHGPTWFQITEVLPTPAGIPKSAGPKFEQIGQLGLRLALHAHKHTEV